MDTNALTKIRNSVRRILPTGVASSVGLIAESYPPLDQIEVAGTGRMSLHRLQEFSAGRAHARTVLQELGLRTPVVPVGAGRAPLWPHGFVGSISHAGAVALAVAAPCAALRAIGVDLEPDLPLEEELLNRVCRPDELARLQKSPFPLLHAKLIFSAKESAYKCVAPLARVFLEFADLEIEFAPGGQRFWARGHGPAEILIRPDTIRGRFEQAGGYWITAAWQPPRPQADSGQDQVSGESTGDDGAPDLA